jgi:hypothetical protein
MNGLQLITAPTTLVAFSVALQHSINLGQDQPVEFDKVVTNIGNGFNVRHGHFTAPVKGLYLISGSLFTNAGYYAHIDIVKNGKAIAYLYSYSNTDVSTQTVMVTMEVGDMMWMKHRGDAIGKSNIYGDTTEQFTTFSGVLIQPMM